MRTALGIVIKTFMILSFASLTWAGVVDLPKTGQTTSYGTGDDGALQAGVAWPSPRFTDNGNGTVTDSLTGLIWLKNANCFAAQSWANALNSANTLASGSCGLTDGSQAGDWRLPNINELESLVHAGEANVATWLNGSGFTNVQANEYWSSTMIAAGANYPWSVNMLDGFVNGKLKSESAFVSPVRAGQANNPNPAYPANIPKTGKTTSYGTGDDGALQVGVAWPSPRFTDNGNGTVTDNLTGLIWLKNANCFGTLPWANALDVANTLASGQCGLSDGSQAGDWRLPNRKELRSLIDSSTCYPALTSGHPFTNVVSDYFWSSTTVADATPNAWSVEMVCGWVGPRDKSNWTYFWPVRDAICTPPPSGLVSWWTGDDTAEDIIGGNDGTLFGGATYADGKVGKAFSFNNDGYVAVSIPTLNTSPSSQVTVDFWMYWFGLLGGDNDPGEMPFGFYDYNLWFYRGSFGFNTAESDVWGIASSGLANRWVHVAAIFNNGDAKLSKLYIDGQEQVLTQRVGTTTAERTVSTNAQISGWPYSSDYWFGGLIDEVEIFNRALSAEEIAAIYNAGSAGKCLPQVISYTVTANATGTGAGTVTSTPAGINYAYPANNTASAQFPHGSNVVLTATANAGSTASWTTCPGTPAGNGTAVATCTMNNLDGAKTAEATFTLIPQNGPDLTGVWQSLTEQTLLSFRRVGQYIIRGSLKVSNIGNQSAGSFRVSYYLSNDGVTLGTLLSQATVCGRSRLSRTCMFNPGQSTNLAFSYPSLTSLKGKYIIAVIDSGNAVAETNENNNRAAGLIQ